MILSELDPGKYDDLPAIGTFKEEHHYYEPNHLIAVVAAWHAESPLLIIGEPGVGKSQLARAVAHKMSYGFLPTVIRPGFKYQDLLWELDAVARLADAQLMAVNKDSSTDVKVALAKNKYTYPGPLWWAHRPLSASKQAHETNRPCPVLGGSEGEPIVLLLDEIDKADADLPNGLLDVFANGDITLPFDCQDEKPGKVLTIITSNGDRPLPPAFVRRCLVLDLRLPDEDKDLFSYLDHICRSRQWADGESDWDSLESIADDTRTIRDTCITLFMKARRDTPPSDRKPSVAEFLDLMRVVTGMGGSRSEQKQRAEELQHLLLYKSL